MPRPASGSRELFVAATSKLLQTRGYHGASIKEIAREAGAPIGSLYFLFPEGKDQLVVEALAASADGVVAALRGVLADHHTPRAVVTAYVGVIQWLLTETDYTGGCPIATVALEVAPHNIAIADTIAAAFNAWTAELRTALRRTGLNLANAKLLASMSLAAVEGALVIARSKRTPDVFDDITKGLAKLADQLMPTKRTASNVRL